MRPAERCSSVSWAAHGFRRAVRESTGSSRPPPLKSWATPVRHRRSAYILMVVIGAMGFLLMVALVLARCATTDIRRERMAALESAAEQALQSARTWGQVHADELARSERITLPMDEAIWPGVGGAAELSRGDGGATRVNCRLTLQRGRLRVTRQVSWPVVEAPSGNPAADAARP